MLDKALGRRIFTMSGKAGFYRTEEGKKAIRIRMLGNKNGLGNHTSRGKGVPKSEETKRKMSLSAMGKPGSVTYQTQICRERQSGPRVAVGKKTTLWYRARQAWKGYWLDNIPDNFEIHHFDRNPKNNDIGNLVACSRSDHRKFHSVKKI